MTEADLEVMESIGKKKRGLVKRGFVCELCKLEPIY